ncbi:hypothetical protein OAJ65_01365 [Flavobacteriales bacterium]|nr:hypothetical protein [Flavobacteriales bacterium]
MRKLLFLSMLFLQTIYTQAQEEYVHQVLVLNEGYFDYTNQQIIEPVTIGSYNPISKIYTEVAVIDSARFASDMIIDNGYFYVAADNKILKYDLNNYVLLEEVTVQGVRNLAIFGDNLFVTRGEYMVTFDSYLQVYDKDDLSFVTEYDTINGPKWAAQDMLIDNNILYVAINNGFQWGNEKGFIGCLDLSNMLYLNEIDLGVEGKNPDNIMIDGDIIYTINNKDWSGMSISEFNITTTLTTTTNITSVSTGCGTSCIRNGNVSYQVSGDTELYEWNGTYSSPIGMSNSFYSLAPDNINNLLYASSTDWFSYGEIFVYDSDNVLIETFSCGVSPGDIEFDLRTATTGVHSLVFEDQGSSTILYDLFGRVINSKNIKTNSIYIKDNQQFYILK